MMVAILTEVGGGHFCQNKTRIVGIVPCILFHADICVVDSYLASALGSLVVDGVILSHAKSFRRSLH